MPRLNSATCWAIVSRLYAMTLKAALGLRTMCGAGSVLLRGLCRPVVLLEAVVLKATMAEAMMSWGSKQLTLAQGGNSARKTARSC